MQKKLTLIISAIILAVAGAIYYYAKVSSEPMVIYTPNFPAVEKSSDYKKREEICKNLSRDECVSNINCEGIFIASCPICDDLSVFNACVPSNLDSNEIQRIKVECSKIEGELRKDPGMGVRCLCNESKYRDNENEGTGCLKDLIYQLQID